MPGEILCGAGFMFFIWERFAGIRGTRRSSAGEWGGLRGSDQIQAGRAGTWSQPGLIAEVRLKHAQTSLRPSAEIQARIRRCREFVRRDLIVCHRADEER